MQRQRDAALLQVRELRDCLEWAHRTLSFLNGDFRSQVKIDNLRMVDCKAALEKSQVEKQVCECGGAGNVVGCIPSCPAYTEKRNVYVPKCDCGDGRTPGPEHTKTCNAYIEKRIDAPPKAETMYTLGPWRDGSLSFSTGWRCVVNLPNGRCIDVADPRNRPTDEEDRANARLIAAAPELLAALKECAPALARFGYDSESVRKAYEAIAKAQSEPVK